jgi:hypothetical protein
VPNASLTFASPDLRSIIPPPPAPLNQIVLSVLSVMENCPNAPVTLFRLRSITIVRLRSGSSWPFDETVPEQVRAILSAPQAS